jgi:hypothetical protein
VKDAIIAGESVQLSVFGELERLVAIEAFQNTRLRPVTDAQSAEVWRQFDQLWNNRGRWTIKSVDAALARAARNVPPTLLDDPEERTRSSAVSLK